MSTVPPEGQGTTTTSTGYGRGSGLPNMPMNVARLPIPGNAEFVFFVIAMILLAIVALASDHYDVPGWVHSFEWLGAAYLLSRGIAKASRVLEQ